MSNGAAAIMAGGPARAVLNVDPLKASAVLWFLVAAAGQWLFAYYVVGFYGVKVAADGLAGFSKAPLMHGYVAGDPVGNLATAAHILLTIVIHGGWAAAARSTDPPTRSCFSSLERARIPGRSDRLESLRALSAVAEGREPGSS